MAAGKSRYNQTCVLWPHVHKDQQFIQALTMCSPLLLVFQVKLSFLCRLKNVLLI